MDDIITMIIEKTRNAAPDAPDGRASGDLLPGDFDQSRMKKALSSPRFTVPPGLSPLEIVAFMKAAAKTGA